VFWVSLPGIPISLGIWVWGYPKHRDTQITVTPPSWIMKLTEGWGWAKNDSKGEDDPPLLP